MWKTDNVVLPNNRQAAMKRFYALEKRFHRDNEFAKKYDAVVQEYISLGHARLLSTEEAKSEKRRTWYLPHHGVVNLASSTTKVRVVFDGAAEYEDTSLNKNLLRGPNILVNLIGVLLRFRRNLVPVGADIEKNVSLGEGTRRGSSCSSFYLPFSGQSNGTPHVPDDCPCVRSSFFARHLYICSQQGCK